MSFNFTPSSPSTNHSFISSADLSGLVDSVSSLPSELTSENKDIGPSSFESMVNDLNWTFPLVLSGKGKDPSVIYSIITAGLPNNELQQLVSIEDVDLIYIRIRRE